MPSSAAPISLTLSAMVSSGTSEFDSGGACMLGALLGDIIGSVYEFAPIKTTDFDLFQRSSTYTDETVLTLAVAHAIFQSENYQFHIRRFAKAHPDVHGGYGNNFKFWLYTGGHEPYHSGGVGPAARVSPIGWAFPDLPKTCAEAEKSARATQDHPDAIKGAVAVAHAIFLGRTGSSLAQMKNEIASAYEFNLDTPLSDARMSHVFDATAPCAVPLALRCVFEADSCEDAIRNAVSLGGDADTLASLAGGVAEAFFGVPATLEREVMKRLPEQFADIIYRFQSFTNGQQEKRLSA
ncbi:MAG: hypothetical protein RIR26_2840 [Pseudomonadota bacterium]